jgi:hypothetical protein
MDMKSKLPALAETPGRAKWRASAERGSSRLRATLREHHLGRDWDEPVDDQTERLDGIRSLFGTRPRRGPPRAQTARHRRATPDHHAAPPSALRMTIIELGAGQCRFALTRSRRTTSEARGTVAGRAPR